jgi:hypothetical protein
MSIELDPPELGFKRECPELGNLVRRKTLTGFLRWTGPFNQEVCQILHLRNPTQEPLVFKVRRNTFT